MSAVSPDWLTNIHMSSRKMGACRSSRSEASSRVTCSGEVLFPANPPTTLTATHRTVVCLGHNLYKRLCCIAASSKQERCLLLHAALNGTLREAESGRPPTLLVFCIVMSAYDNFSCRPLHSRAGGPQQHDHCAGKHSRACCLCVSGRTGSSASSSMVWRHARQAWKEVPQATNMTLRPRLMVL